MQITAVTGAPAKQAIADGEFLRARAEEISSLESAADLEEAVAAFRCLYMISLQSCHLCQVYETKKRCLQQFRDSETASRSFVFLLPLTPNYY